LTGGQAAAPRSARTEENVETLNYLLACLLMMDFVGVSFSVVHICQNIIQSVLK